MASLRLSCIEWQLDVEGPTLPAPLPIISVGCEAARVMSRSRRGSVLASFVRSFYVQCDHGIFCVGVASLGEGPLHIVLASGSEQQLAQVTPGLTVSIQSNIPQQAVAEIRDLAESYNESGTGYSGKVTGISISPVVLHTIQHVMTLVVASPPQGFGWILSNTDTTATGKVSDSMMVRSGTVDASLRKQSAPALLALSRWLEASLSSTARAGTVTLDKPVEPGSENTLRSHRKKIDTPLPVSDLLGAGPGLTPAGDDLLAGVMLALHRVDRSEQAILLWTCLEPFVLLRTNAISAVHLRFAAQGQCAAHVLELIGSVFNTKEHNHVEYATNAAVEIQSCANRIGASSGWDMLAGMSLVLCAL